MASRSTSGFAELGNKLFQQTCNIIPRRDGRCTVGVCETPTVRKPLCIKAIPKETLGG